MFQVVVAAGKFGDLYLHFLNKYKIMAVRLVHSLLLPDMFFLIIIIF